jgi:hypothetical protein
VNQLIQQKADAATAIAASSAVVTWIEHANDYVDFVAGIMAIVASAFAIAWYIKKWNMERNDGTTSEDETEGTRSE